MARKKEYSADDDGNSQRSQRPSPSSSSSVPPDAASRKQVPPKRRDQGSPCGSSASAVYDVNDLRTQLGPFGLTLRDIPGDGNCLFRALGDQLDGHSMNHMKHRMDTVRYMIAHRNHFEPFIDIPFDRYMDNLSRPGTYAGQDALVAFARLHKVNIVIHQLNSPLWQIEGCEAPPHGGPVPELHLSYHNGEHYSSVRRFGDFACAPAHIRLVSNLMGAAEVPCCASHSSVSTASAPVTSHASAFAGGGPVACPGAFVPPAVLASPNPTPHPPSAPPDSHQLPYHHNEDHFSVLLQQVMMRSGYRDSTIATEALIDSGCDVDHTVDYLLSLSLILEPNESNEALPLPARSERDPSLEKGGLIEEAVPRPRVSCRRGAEQRVDRHRAVHRQPSRPQIHDSQQMIPAGRHDKKPRKQSAGTKGRTEGQRDVDVERDLRFLTL